MNSTKEIKSDHKKDVARYFSTHSDYWQKVYEQDDNPDKTFLTREMSKRKTEVLRLLDKYSEGRQLKVLDVGSGAGIFMKEIVQAGHNAVGVDLSEEMLKHAREMVKDTPDSACCIRADVEKLPFQDGTFAAVVCIGVLQFLQNDEQAVREMNRVVKSGGIIILTLPNIFKISNFFDPYYYLIRVLHLLSYKTGINKPSLRDSSGAVDFGRNVAFINRRYFYGQLSRLFKRHNLRNIDSAGTGYGPLTFWKKKMFPDKISIRVTQLFERVVRNKYLSFMSVFANQWVICLQKGHSVASE